MRNLTFLSIFVSQIVFANDPCIDVALLGQMKTRSVNRDSEMSKIINFYQKNVQPKILNELERTMNAENIKLNEAPFKIRWIFDKNGGIQAKCDCEEILELSKDISEAKSVLKILNSSVREINKSKVDFILSSQAQKLEYCATSKFKTEQYSNTKSEPKKSITGTSQ